MSRLPVTRTTVWTRQRVGVPLVEMAAWGTPARPVAQPVADLAGARRRAQPKSRRRVRKAA